MNQPTAIAVRPSCVQAPSHRPRSEWAQRPAGVDFVLGPDDCSQWPSPTELPWVPPVNGPSRVPIIEHRLKADRGARDPGPSPPAETATSAGSQRRAPGEADNPGAGVKWTRPSRAAAELDEHARGAEAVCGKVGETHVPLPQVVAVERDHRAPSAAGGVRWDGNGRRYSSPKVPARAWPTDREGRGVRPGQCCYPVPGRSAKRSSSAFRVNPQTTCPS